MIKSIVVASIIFLTVFTSVEIHAQEPDESKTASAGQAAEPASSSHSPAVVATSAQPAPRATERGTAQVPLANLFPTREPDVRDKINPTVAPPPARPRQGTLGLQHEFHGELTTSFSNSNGVPN